ncbi:unnamed protein product [Closterium sp. NIES-65]|nr:unnamed protein product [Closterium sp. NIES-65]CAI5966449.1 unnamed protein product [Closterium sp. NIES-65]
MGVGPGLRRIGGDEFGGSRGAEEVGVRRRVVVRAVGPEIGSNAAYDVIGSLGLDTLTFLVATVIVIPAFKSLKISPILGFLLSGVALNELGLIRNITDVKALSELGILFLLFEMGLELSLERLRALAKFAFGMGLPQVLLTTLDGSKASAAHLSSLDSSLPPALPLSSLQVLLTTLAFTAFELPIDNAIGTRALEFLFGAKADLVNIRSLDEAIVIGAALALSSSAFVLQLLSEKGELATRYGSATLGILLLQDIAVVPLLVILPILENGDFTDDSVFPLLALEGAQDFTDDSVFPLLALEGAKSLLGLGALLYTGRIALRRLFEFVAESRSSEAFIALCLLTVTGTALITSKLGFSDSLGAFLAGALLAETNYRTQVEADIRPFRGLLLGLFFVTTGSSIDLNLLASERPNILALLAGLIGIKAAIVTPFNSLSPTLASEWPNILALLTGLIGIKAAIITALGPRVGLTLSESVRTGLLLSQGGEFAFVVFALANQLGVLPLELNRLLIIVVVLSMALTPFLDALGRRAAEYIEDNIESRDAATVAAAGVRGGAAVGRLGPGGNGAMSEGEGSMEGQQVSPCLSAVAARAVSGVGGVAESVGRLGAGGNETMSEADGGMEGQQVSPCLSAVAAGGAGPIVTLGFNRMGQVLTSVPSPPYSRINPLLLMSPSQAGASHSTHFAGAEPIVISVFNQMGQAGASHSTHFAGAEPIVILGFNQMGQVLANFLSTPLAAGSGGDAAGWNFISFDLNPKRVRLGASLGFPVLYGDGSRPAVLESAGISRPKAFMVVYSSRTRSVASIERLKEAFPGVPLYARAVDAVHLSELRRAGATDVVLESAETRLYAAAGDGGDAGRPGVCAISPSRPPLIQPLLLFSPVPSLQTGLRLGSMLLQDMGVMRDDVVFVRRLMRDAMDQRALSASSSQSSDLISSRPLLETLKETLGRRAIRPIEPTAFLMNQQDDRTAAPSSAASAAASAVDGDTIQQENPAKVAAFTATRASTVAATAAAAATAGVLVASKEDNTSAAPKEEGEGSKAGIKEAPVARGLGAAELPSLESPMGINPVFVLADAQASPDGMLQYFSDGEDFVDRNLSLDASQLPAGATMPPSLDSPAVLGEGFGSEGLQAAAGERLVYFSDGDDFVDVKLELPQSGDFPREK